MNFKFRNNSVVCLGDTHGLRDTERAVLSVEAGKDVVHVGDVGVGFCALEHDKAQLAVLNKICAERNINLYLLRGNHDCPDYFWENRISFSNVFFVKDYDYFTFPNKKRALAVGGGVSIDRIKRIEGKSYWKNEITPLPPNKLGLYDIVFAHDCPSWVGKNSDSLHEFYTYYVNNDKNLIKDCNKQRAVMDKVFNKVRPSLWIHGHYHYSFKDRKNECNFECLDINELCELSIC